MSTYANEILNVFNKRPNNQINIENQHLGKCRIRYMYVGLPDDNFLKEFLSINGLIHDVSVEKTKEIPYSIKHLPPSVDSVGQTYTK